MAAAAPSRRPRAWLPWAAAILLACVCALVPFWPGLPGEGLDESWNVAMNQAVAQGLVFGRDLVFTFGPYASVYTHQFHPATDARMLWGSLLLALALGALLALLLREASWRARIALLAIFSGLLTSPDPVYVFMIVAAGALCERLGRPGQGAPREPVLAATLFLLFLPLGLLPLVKGSTLALAVVIAVLACVLCLLRRQWLVATAVLLGPLAGAALAWHLAGLPWSGLPDYVAAMQPIVSGYTEAMSSTGKPQEVVFAALASLALVWRLARREAPAAEKWLLLLMFAAGLFLAFKGGFVRQDAHAGTTGTFLLLACCILPWPRGRVGNAFTLALVLLAWHTIDRHYFGTTPARYVQQVRNTYEGAWAGLRLRIAEPAGPAAAFQARLQEIAGRTTFGRLAGSTDIYSHGQVELIAAGNRWNPRPVLQSYSAYTPELAERDRRHLAGAGAPDQVVFRVEAIDDRLPAQEDGSSWPELLARYEPADRKGDALLLRKRATAQPLAECGTRTTQHALGETVRLPAADCATLARFDLRPSVAGRLAGLAYKPSQLEVRLELADGTQRKYRLVSGMARAGLLLSPLVENAADFGLLYAGVEQLRFKDVRSLTVTARKPWMWNATYTLEQRGLRLPPQPAALRLYASQPAAQAAGERAVVAASDCVAGFEAVNGTAVQARFSAGRTLGAQGWLATPPALANAPAWLVLADGAGRHFLLPAQRTARHYVPGRADPAGLAVSGLRAEGSVAGLRGDFHLAVGFEDQGRIRTCPGADVAGVLSGAP